MRSTLATAVAGLLVIPAGLTAAEGRRIGDVLPDFTVRFQIGSAQLTTRSNGILDRLAKLLKRRAELAPVLLVGHADDRGSNELNDRLSLNRAEGVRAALIKRGIKSSRLKTEGVGSREPLSDVQTEAARTRNRRVEIWVTPRGPVARVGRVERRVQAREPAAPDWQKAQQNQALRQLSRVRTLARSSTEIRFPRDDRVTMGPDALAVIYSTPSATRKSRRATADVDLEAGSLFATLAQREGRIIDVQSRTSRVRVRSKRTRVNARNAKKQSTIEVYDGESEVEGAGKSVVVPRGYGTRVLDGQAPEPPQPLPPAPDWTDTRPIFRLEGEPVELRWKAPPDIKAAELQMGVGYDVDIERPVRLDRVEGSTTTTDALPGMYIARMASIDAKGLIGEAGAPRPVVVLPTPRLADTSEPVRRPSPDENLVLPRPGTVRFYAPPDAVLSILGQSSTVAIDIDLYESRRLVAGLKAADGGPTRYIGLDVDVPAQRVASAVGQPVALPEGGAVIPVDIRVTDEAGRGVDGLDFQVGGVTAASDRLVTSTATAGVLAPCHCEIPARTTPAEPLGDGRYRWSLTASTAAAVPSTVRFYAEQGSRAVETQVPPDIAAQVDGIAPASQTGGSGFFATLHAGTWLGTTADPVMQVGLGLGGRIPIQRRLSIDAWALARWFQRRERNEDINIFPLTARLALSYAAGWPQLYLGGGAGLRVGDIETRPVGEVFAGVLLPISAVDVDLEGGYTAAGSTDRIDELAGWGLRIGLRWVPGR